MPLWWYPSYHCPPLKLAVAHRFTLISKSVGFLLPLGTPKGDGIGDLIKCLVLCLWDEEENEEDGCCQNDREDDVGVLLQPILGKRKRQI